MATRTDICPCGVPHTKPTLDETVEFDSRLYDALQAIDKAWGIANRTPGFHDLTERIGAVMADLTSVKRTLR